jgi:hypothetical protein
MEDELVVSHSDMDAAYRQGHATLLNHSIPWLTRYRDSWWVVYDGGWRRVPDELVAADIYDRLQRIAGADAAERGAPCSPGRSHEESL